MSSSPTHKQRAAAAFMAITAKHILVHHLPSDPAPNKFNITANDVNAFLQSTQMDLLKDILDYLPHHTTIQATLDYAEEKLFVPTET
jgi:hypothetical protein